MGSSTLVPDRSSTPVAVEYPEDVAGEALGADDDASETDEPNISAPVAPAESQHHDDPMGDRWVILLLTGWDYDYVVLLALRSVMHEV